MQLKTVIKFSCPEARAQFDAAALLFNAAECANAAGLADLCAELGQMAIKRFNAAKDRESQMRSSLRVANHFVRA